MVSQYRHGLRTMKGGLTISGGEPLMQHRFVLKLFAAVQKLGVHTALDTNGYLGDRLSDEDLGSIDLVHARPQGHHARTSPAAHRHGQPTRA